MSTDDRKSMNIVEYANSADNRKTLSAYAHKQLVQQWPKQSNAVSNAITFVLDDCITEGLGPYRSWANTKENAADVNVSIFKVLRTRVESMMKGAQVDHEEELTEMFRGPAQRDSVRYEPADGVTQDRELESLRERHMEAWR